MKKLSSKRKKQISRRDFFNNTFAGMAAAFFYPLTELLPTDNIQQEIIKWPEDAVKFRFHMTGHAHIDPVWLWPWSEGVAIVHSTFRSALEWMKKNPEFCFTASSAQFYE